MDGGGGAKKLIGGRVKSIGGAMKLIVGGRSEIDSRGL